MENKLFYGISILFVIFILMLSGCAPKMVQPDVKDTTDTVKKTETVKEETTTETETEEEEEETVVEEVEEEEEDVDYNFEALPKEQQRKVKLVRNLLEEARGRDENYFFRFSSPKILQTAVWVKSDVIKREIRRPSEMDKTKPYNMVYLDTGALTAKGYCETSKAKCWEGKGPFSENYNKWLIKTPKQWVMELGDEFTFALDNKIGDQLYHIVDFRKDGKTIRVYVNDYRGWPARVEVYNREVALDSLPTGSPDEEYIYDDMDIGGVSEDDVTPG
ncbi:hypothetical protein ACFL3V_01175 [Nanoarchaeota archaeon]